jgi:hypothetical protein
MASESSVGLAGLLTNTEKRTDIKTWTNFCPKLSIEDDTTDTTTTGSWKMASIPESESNWRRNRLISDGFVLVDDGMNVDLVNALREGIESLHQLNLPASFILLYDETWQLARDARRIMEASSHSQNKFNFDLLAWFIPLGTGGFSPHRDRQPADAASTFHSDHQAKFLTQWIALSDATPENSCLYVIPKQFDPGYTSGDTDETGDPLQRALTTKESYQHIRALPRKAGQSILFTHRIIHWGSQGDIFDESKSTKVEPRIAISFVCSDPDYEAPLLVNHGNYFPSNDDNGNPLQQSPPLKIRLLLVCAQLLIYYQRFELDKAVIKACYDYCKMYEDELEENYRHKVYLEFVKAMKEQQPLQDQETLPETTSKVSNEETKYPDENGSHDDDDDEEAVLEEMLNAEEGGYGEFEDDYDEIEDEIQREEGEKIDFEDKQEEGMADEWEEEEKLNLVGNGKRGNNEHPEDAKTTAKKKGKLDSN